MRQHMQAKKIKELDIAAILKKKANLILKKYAKYKGQAAGKYGEDLNKFIKTMMKNPPYVSPSAGGGTSMFLIFVIIILLAVIGAGGYFCFSMKPDLLGSVVETVAPAQAPAIAEAVEAATE